MTTDTEDLEHDEREQRDVEADAGLEAGFNRVRGEASGAKDTGKPASDDDEDPEKGKPDSQTDAEAKAKADVEAQAKAEADAKAKADQEAYDALPKRLRDQVDALAKLPDQINNLAGHFGGLKRQVTDALATAKAAAKTKGAEAPTDQQIADAMGNPEAMKKFVEDYPDFKVLADELAAVAAKAGKGASVDVATLEKNVTEKVTGTVSSQLAAARELAKIDAKHPDWEDTLKTDDFKAYWKTLPEEQRKAADASARGTIAVLDGFIARTKAKGEEQQKSEEERLRRERRMRGATTPTGVPASASTVISDDEGLTRGFKRVRGGK